MGALRRLVRHLVRAGVRYDRADGGRLAAAVTYYAFFAVFGLALLSLAILGYVVDDPGVLRSVQTFLDDTLPQVDAEAIRGARDTVGVIALVGLPITGLFWVDSLRSSIRAIWQVDEYPGNFFVRQAIDLAVLIGLGLFLGASLALEFGTSALAQRIVKDPVGLDTLGFVLGLGVNVLLAVAVLTAVPRLRMPFRRVIGPALLIAGGLEVLKTIGRVFLDQTTANPAYHVVATAVGLLLFLSVMNQLVLFAASLTATSHAGRVIDLAARRVISTPEGERLTVPRRRVTRRVTRQVAVR